MYIRRHIEEKLKSLIKQYPALLITGPRQVGKSTVMEQLFSESHKSVIFENPLLLREATKDPGLFLKNYPPPIMLDEIQYVPELFRYIKMYIDRSKKDGEFLLTGSQAFSLMNNGSESLAGRVGILELQGLSLREKFGVKFYDSFIPTEEYIEKRKKNLVQYDNIWEKIHRGSLPRLVREDIEWTDYYAAYVKTYIERDVRLLTQVADEELFMNFMIALAARTGELLNYNNIANSIGVSVPTVKRWVSILKTSGIIFTLEPFSNNALKRAVKTPKVYFYDTGLVCFLTKWLTPETIKNGAKAGNIFETFVISEIAKTYLNAGIVMLPLYYYRDNDQKEIDLVIEENGTLYPIEIKLTANPSEKMASAFAILDKITTHKRGMGAIICFYEDAYYLKNDLVSLPLEYI